jgi:hypothetical protein
MDQKQVTVIQSQPVIPFSDIERMAVAFAKSGLFGIKTPEQGIALMLIAQAEGMHPAIAARDYHVIQGRPALKADSMLARFQAAGGKVVWNAYTDTSVSATFSHPQGGSATVEWTIQQAKAAGLTSKDVWRQYPRAMLRARVISEGIRTVYPGVSVGVYTPEEIQDMDAKPATKEVQSESVSVQKPTIAAVIEEQLAKPIPPKPSEEEVKARSFKIIKESGWSKDELSSYSRMVFGVDSASELKLPQLELLAAVTMGSSYPVAVAEFKDGQEDSFDADTAL